MSKILNKYIILILCFYVFWLGILPRILTKTLDVFCQKFSHKSNYELVIEKPKLTLSVLPVANFSANKLVLKSKKTKDSFIIQELRTELRILPLLSGRLHLNEFKSKDFNLVLSLEKDVELGKNFFDELENTKFRCNFISVENYKFEFYQKDLREPILYSGKDFIYQRKNRFLKLKFDSSIKLNNKSTVAKVDLYLPKNNDIKKTVFDINISNFDIAPLRSYLKHYLPEDLVALNGIINVQADKGQLCSEIIKGAILYKDVTKSIYLPEKINIVSSFKINRDFINIENSTIKSKNVDVILSGKVFDYISKTATFLDLNILVNNSNVEDFIKMSPAFKVEEIDMQKLKKYKFYGKALANLNIKGRLPEPDINGEVYISDGVLIKPIPNTDKGATIKLKFIGKNVGFDVQVPAGNSQKVSVVGTQEIYNVKYAELTVKSTESVDLKVVQNVVNPLHEILNFIVGPVPIMDIRGKGNIDILVKGNRKNPHIWGTMNFLNSNVGFKDIPDLNLENANAILSFNDKTAVFKNSSGTVNNKEFNISGTCDLDGKFDFDILSQNQPSVKLYQAITNSNFISEYTKVLPKFDNIQGQTDLSLKIYGAVKHIEDLAINKNVFAKGEITLKNNSFALKNITTNNANGQIKLDGTNTDTQIDALIENSPMQIKSKIKYGFGDIIVNIPRLNPNFIFDTSKYNAPHCLPIVSLVGKYRGSVENFEYNKLNLVSKVLDSDPNSDIKYTSGEVVISNNKANIKNLSGYIGKPENLMQADLKIDNVFSELPIASGVFVLKSPDVSAFNILLANKLYPEKVRRILNDFELKKGAIDLKCRIFDNKAYADVDLSGISFEYIPLELPVDIVNGKLSLRNDLLKLNKINVLADRMPVLFDGEIKNIFDKQNFNIYLSSKPMQEFIDKYINKNQIYPIKIKGDIVYWARFKGVPDNYDVKAQFDMSKDSSIYHFGATVGDVENAIVIALESKIIDGTKHRIKEFLYDKVIDSQSGRKTRLNMLKAWGDVEILSEDLLFDDLHIKTSNPTDARIFNIIFRKPNIKQGQFVSDLKFKGHLSNPKVLGKFHITETNIPFFDTVMKNIEFEFNDKTVELVSKGEVMGNDVAFEGVMKNKLTQPYHFERGYFYTKDLDLNRIVNNLKIAEIESISNFESLEAFSLKSLIFNDLKIKADNIRLRNLNATNFDAQSSLNSAGLINVQKFKFNVADGNLDGNYQYNINTEDMRINFLAESINANDLATALFDLDNQIYGDLTGKVDLTCNGEDFNKCMQTLSGVTMFNVKDGRMPKLGSLEYLLKAGNLVKGGITGLSINSVIDLISPLKTGEFSNIFGSVNIKDGLARNIEITTQGEDLSLFIGGTYNFANSNADMQVLGLLARKISNILGPIGNISINTLFNVIPGVDLAKDSVVLEKINKIPGIELSSKAYRKFIADIKGNINGDDYVTSFKWIN